MSDRRRTDPLHVPREERPRLVVQRLGILALTAGAGAVFLGLNRHGEPVWKVATPRVRGRPSPRRCACSSARCSCVRLCGGPRALLIRLSLIGAGWPLMSACFAVMGVVALAAVPWTLDLMDVD